MVVLQSVSIAHDEEGRHDRATHGGTHRTDEHVHNGSKQNVVTRNAAQRNVVTRNVVQPMEHSDARRGVATAL